MQLRIELEAPQLQFLEQCQRYGFQDRETLVREAIERLRLALESLALQESAALYAEVYESCEETQQLTEATLTSWPK